MNELKIKLLEQILSVINELEYDTDYGYYLSEENKGKIETILTVLIDVEGIKNECQR